MKKKIKYVILIGFLFCLALLIIVPYSKVEFLTIKYGAEFSEEFNQIGMFDSVDFLRVMDYTNESAQVYYTINDDAAGILVYFTKSNSRWELSKWKTIWSSSGSADSFMWPYYR